MNTFPIIKYVLSAHGEDKQTASAKLSKNGTIFFYVNNNEILVCEPKLQTRICAMNSSTYSHTSSNIIIGGNHYPSSMIFYKDENKYWKSGLIDCYWNTIVLNLDNINNFLTLKNIISELENYHNYYYPNNNYELHILACRIDTRTNSPKAKEVIVHSNTKYLKYKEKYLIAKNKIDLNNIHYN